MKWGALESMQMESNLNSCGEASPARRPSLFDAPAQDRSRTPARDIAVLASLEEPVGKRNRSRWLSAIPVAVGTALVVLAAAAGLALYRPVPVRQVAVEAHHEGPEVKTLASNARLPSAPSSAASSIPVSPPAATSARVESVEPAPLPHATTGSLLTALNATPPEGASTSPPIAAGVRAKSPNPVHSHPAKPVARSAHGQESGRKPTLRGGGGEDSDTALLAALVKHIEAPGASARAAVPDVVLREHGAKTAELVARCDRLGGLEGSLCRKRICQGQWGKDAACPAREMAATRP